MTRLVLLSAILLALGCSTTRINGKIISVTSTVFGLDVSASPTSEAMPAVRLGLVRTEVLICPTNAAYSADTDASNKGFLNVTVHRSLATGGAATNCSSR